MAWKINSKEYYSDYKYSNKIKRNDNNNDLLYIYLNKYMDQILRDNNPDMLKYLKNILMEKTGHKRKSTLKKKLTLKEQVQDLTIEVNELKGRLHTSETRLAKQVISNDRKIEKIKSLKNTLKESQRKRVAAIQQYSLMIKAAIKLGILEKLQLLFDDIIQQTKDEQAFHTFFGTKVKSILDYEQYLVDVIEPEVKFKTENIFDEDDDY